MRRDDNSPEYIAELTELFHVLGTGHASDIKAARAGIERNRYGRNGRLAGAMGRAFILDQIERISRSDSIINRAACIRGLVTIGFDTAELAFTETIALVLSEIQHESGTVREAARRLISYLRMGGYGKTASEYKKQESEYVAFVHALGALLIEYRGDITEKYIEKLKPSVFKTIAIAWDEANVRTIYEPWISQKDAKDYNPPVHEYNDPDWVDENEVNPEEIERELWRTCQEGSPNEARRILTLLETASRKRLAVEMELFGFKPSDTDAVAVSFTMFGNDYGPSILTRLLDQVVRARRIKYPEEFSGVVRALQGYVNHRIQKNVHGEPYSDILVNAVAMREEYGRHKPKDLVAFMQTIRDTHDAIDAYFHEWKIAREKSAREHKAWMQEHGFNDTTFDQSHGGWDFYEKKIMREALSIAHHALDWYVQAEPWNVNRMDSRKLAAVAWNVVRRINEDYRQDRRVFLSLVSSASLSTFGGWASPGAITQSALGATNAVLRECADPDLFLLITEEQRD